MNCCYGIPCPVLIDRAMISESIVLYLGSIEIDRVTLLSRPHVHANHTSINFVFYLLAGGSAAAAVFYR